MRVIGIETSCDETGVAIYDSRQDLLLSDLLYTQVDLHRQYGGVVPEIASRDHIRKTLPMIMQAMADAECSPADINGIAYTAGPGLVGALLVGASVAKSVALAWQVPSLGVHHMEGHLMAATLCENPPQYPFVALLVSGGHTLLLACREPGKYHMLGESVDDAAGEAFDKVAKMLDLGYPGGPEIAKLAAEGDPARFTFPRPMTGKPGLNFSFSGLKTHVLTTVKGFDRLNDQDRADIAVAFEEAVVDTIRIKCQRALTQTGYRTLVIAGGVSANLALRSRLDELGRSLDTQICFPAPNLCTDNGAMIAYAGCLRLERGQREGLSINVLPRWPMESLS